MTTPLTQSNLPRVVEQALDDVHLPAVARLMMWHVVKRLDLFEYREVKLASIAAEMRVKETTGGVSFLTPFVTESARAAISRSNPKRTPCAASHSR